MAEVSCRKVVKNYDGGVQAVKGIDLEIADQEFVVLVGPSGCGKSTTLRMIAGLEEITDGEIWIGGDVVNDVPPRDRDIAMVFQNYALYPHMSVFDNMAFGLKLRKFPKDEIKRRVDEAARILDIGMLLDRKPRALSGGQRQRVAMGRAIVRNPKVFLFDEPLSNLDAKLRVQMRTEIKKVHQTVRTTTVYVTHDQIEAMTLADRVVVMNHGVIEQVGYAERAVSPPDDAVRRRLHRLAGDELPAGARAGWRQWRAGGSRHRPDRAAGAAGRAPIATASTRAGRWCSACGRSICSSTTRTAARLGARRTAGRCGGADGHGDDGPLLHRPRSGVRPRRSRDARGARRDAAADRGPEPDAPDGAGQRPGGLAARGPPADPAAPEGSDPVTDIEARPARGGLGYPSLFPVSITTLVFADRSLTFRAAWSLRRVVPFHRPLGAAEFQEHRARRRSSAFQHFRIAAADRVSTAELRNARRGKRPIGFEQCGIGDLDSA